MIDVSRLTSHASRLTPHAMRYQSYFNTALSLIHQYDGSVPLAHFLRNYFAQHKKHGSKDRKWIAHLCYTYYRLGWALRDLPAEERLRAAIFLGNETAGEWNIVFNDNWLGTWSADLQERLATLASFYSSFSVTSIFPWDDQLSSGIDPRAFSFSHLIQPDLFVRVRPGREKLVLQKLAAAQVPFEQETGSCLRLPNGSKIETVLEIDRDVVIQDKSSQEIGGLLQTIATGLQLTTPNVWDCCAASGGKSILAKDVLGSINITVSDIRPSILQNLAKRFERSGIKNFESFICDLSSHKPPAVYPDLIICDAPCSGSGTWGRTPEQLYFFSQEKIESYAALQKKIVTHAISRLNKGGYFLYITCSVFAKENEYIAEMIQKELKLELVKAAIIKGFDVKADTMYAALFKL